MGQGTLRLLDSDGREILGAIDDQQLRVRLELDIDPASAPNEITVEVVAPDGIHKETITAERIDWGAKRPLYQTDLTTVDEIFSRIHAFEVPAAEFVERTHSAARITPSEPYESKLKKLVDGGAVRRETARIIADASPGIIQALQAKIDTLTDALGAITEARDSVASVQRKLSTEGSA